MVGEEGVEGGLVLVAVHDLEGQQQEQVTLHSQPFPLPPAGDVRGRFDPEQRVAPEPDDPSAWPGELQPGPALQPSHDLAGGGPGPRQVRLETSNLEVDIPVHYLQGEQDPRPGQ